MRLYRLIVRGRARYVGTQADARAMKRETGEAWAEIDVPTDKAGLLVFLNENAPAITQPGAPPPPLPPTAATQPPAPAPLVLDATSILARMDNPGLNIDAIVNGIAALKGGYALKRVAGAVAVRFEELAR